MHFGLVIRYRYGSNKKYIQADFGSTACLSRLKDR